MTGDARAMAGDVLYDFVEPWISAVFIAYQCNGLQPITPRIQQGLM